jgi:hypothetical protein
VPISDSTSSQKHRQLENSCPFLSQTNPQYYIHFSTANHVAKALLAVIASASFPLTTKTHLLLLNATTDKMTNNK